MRSRSWAALILAVSLPACGRREPAENAFLRVNEAALLQQIEDLKVLIARAEKGELSTQDRIAIGIAEDTAKALFDASLPQEKLLGERVLVRLEAVQPLFRGNNAAVLFQASARGKTGASARLELAGRLVNYRVEKGRLTAGVEMLHFKVLESSLGDAASDVLEGLVRDNLGALSGMIPSFEIPVHLEQSIKIAGLNEGVVVVKPGSLPLDMTLGEVIPVNQRLWILLDVKAGPWKSTPASEKKAP